MLDRRPLTALGSLAMISLVACSTPELPDDPIEHFSEGFVELGSTRSLAVDILIVLDNSSSMAEEQAMVAQNAAWLIEVLETEEVAADYRIAITTTDAGHPGCPTGTPEQGAFVLTPCTSRLDEFVADGEGGSVDARAPGCTDLCSLTASELEIQPTRTDEDPNPAPRPWLERHLGRSNLPEGVDMGEALACFMPQGVAGCDFEAPLESMSQALTRARSVTDPAYGFLRKDAALFVLIVTDEDDCSTNTGVESLFSVDATSATCWSAGVTCTGDPGHYDDCEPINTGLDGTLDVPDADAVLRAPSRYIALLDGILAEKQALDPTPHVVIGVIGGVRPNGDLYFADVGDSDPAFQHTYGIGPGCSAQGVDFDHPIRATPPPRLRAVVEALTPNNMLSICEPDWSPALEVLAPRLWGPIRPACFPECVLDSDPATPEVEPDCIVEQLGPGSDRRERVPECARDEDGYVLDPMTYDFAMPAADVDVCHALLTDPGGTTPSHPDDMSVECSDNGFNLEFKIARRPGHPATPDTRVTATCRLSDAPSLACPSLL